jgi:hypothetical protein
MKKPKQKRPTSLMAPSDTRWYVDRKVNCPSGLPDTRIVVDLQTGLPRTVDVSEAGTDFWQEVKDPGLRVDLAVRQFEHVFVDLQQWRKEPSGTLTSPHLQPKNFRIDLPEWAVSAPLL